MQAIILLLIFILFTFLGYVFHWMFHQEWSGIFYRKHKNHHEKQYPETDLISDVYREAGADNTTFLFLGVFSPIIIGTILLMVFGVVGKIFGGVILFEMVVIGLINAYLHDSFHLNKSIWHKWPAFDRLRKLHFIHHHNQSKNFGIFSFVWDRMFKSYSE